MRFWKENYSGIVKLFVNQIGIAIFSFFLYTAVSAMQPEGKSTPVYFNILISVFSLLFYFALLYTAVWEIGAKDKIRVDAGRATREPFKGMIMALYANIPNFLIALISLLCYGGYMLGFGDGFKGAFGVLNAIFRIFISMYLGVVQGLTVTLKNSVDLYYIMQTVYFLILPFVTVLIVHFSYILGLNDRHIIPRSNKNK